MFKKINVVLSIIALCLTVIYAQAHEYNLKLSYRPLADKFHMLDHLTGAIPNDNIHYDHAWSFGLFGIQQDNGCVQSGVTEENKEHFKLYRTIRRKYLAQMIDFFGGTEVPKKSGYFSPYPADIPDPIADAFYCSDTLLEAIEKLTSIVAEEDLSTLQHIFELYDSKLTMFSKHDQEQLKQVIEYINNELEKPEVAQNISEMKAFFKSTGGPFKSMLFFWAPEGSGACGTSYGDHLQVMIPHEYINIEKKHLLRKKIVPAIICDVTHHISSYAQNRQKRKLTSWFKLLVDEIRPIEVIIMLEMRLAIANEMRFLKNTYPDIYEPDTIYEEFLTLLESYVAQSKVIDEYFIEQYSSILKDMIAKSKGCCHF